jgi:pyruvate,water dikinase
MTRADQSDAPRPADRPHAPAAGAHGPPLIATGRPVGDQVVSGVARFVRSIGDLDALRPGEILLAQSVMPEWRSRIERAAAIVTNEDGPASHAARVARELGVPAVVGTVDGASPIWTGAVLTVSCAEGATGRVYEGWPRA